MRSTTVSLVSFIFGVAITLAVIATGWLAPLRPPASSVEWGAFPVQAKVELLDDGRELKLLEDFVYLDPRGRAWTASKGSIVNGASIPKAFWSITGGPLEGKYRNASIVHDEGCAKALESSEKVHLMFYEACRCGGVPEFQAKLLYAAVYHYGPKWKSKPVFETLSRTGPDGKVEAVIVTKMITEIEREPYDPEPNVITKLSSHIKSKNPSLEDIESLIPDSL